jgi:hypothetical protein
VDFTIEFTSGQTWLVRSDKWRYPLAGICSMEMRSDFSDFGTWGGGTFRTVESNVELVVTVGPVTDALLDSLRVLKDELPDHIALRIEGA